MKPVAKMFSDDEYEKIVERELKIIKQDPEMRKFLADRADIITKEMTIKGLNVIREYMRRRNENGAFIPRLRIYGNNFNIDNVPNPQYVEKEKREYWKSMLDIRGLSNDNRMAQITDYELTSERIGAYNAVLEIIENFDRDKNQVGIWLQGGFGIGKSYLMSAMVKELNKKGAGATMIEMGDFVEKYKEQFGNNEDKQAKMLNDLKFVDVLVIDDIGAEHVTEWTIDNVIYPILNTRYKQQKFTCFTSNLTKADYANRLANPSKSTKPSDDSRATAKRVLTRIDGLAKEIQTGGQNRREYH